MVARVRSLLATVESALRMEAMVARCPSTLEQVASVLPVTAVLVATTRREAGLVPLAT
jgi:hypothetical protein